MSNNFLYTYRIYPTKNTTLIKAYQSRNTGKNEVTEFWYGSNNSLKAPTGQTRFVMYFPTAAFNELFSYSDSGQVSTYTLKMFDCSSTYRKEPLPGDTILEVYAITGGTLFSEGYGHDFETNDSLYVHQYATGETFIQDGYACWSGSVNSPHGVDIWNGGDNVKTYQYSSQTTIDKISGLSIDITNIVSAWTTGLLENKGLLIKYTDRLETSAITTKGYSKNFYTRHSHSLFKPYIEVKYSGVITDDRTYLNPSKLYLYTYNDNMPTDIYTINRVNIYSSSTLNVIRWNNLLTPEISITNLNGNSSQTINGCFINSGTSWFKCSQLNKYTGTSDNSLYGLLIEDTSGHSATCYIRNILSESLSSDIFLDPSFNEYSGPNNFIRWTESDISVGIKDYLTGVTTQGSHPTETGQSVMFSATNASGTFRLYQNLTTNFSRYARYKVSLWHYNFVSGQSSGCRCISIQNGSKTIINYNSTTADTSSWAYDIYGFNTNYDALTSSVIFQPSNILVNDTSNRYIDDVSCKRIISDGFRIASGINSGSGYWNTIEYGFDPNKINNIYVYKIGEECHYTSVTHNEEGVYSIDTPNLLNGVYQDAWIINFTNSLSGIVTSNTFTITGTSNLSGWSINSGWAARDVTKDISRYNMWLYGLNNEVRKGEKFKVRVVAKKYYTTTPVILRDLQFRILHNEDEIEFIPWTNVSYNRLYNWFFIDTNWFYENEKYKIELRQTSNSYTHNDSLNESWIFKVIL